MILSIANISKALKFLAIGTSFIPFATMGKAMTLQEARRKGKAAERRGNGPPRLSTSELKLNRKVTEDRKWEIQNTLNEADAEITSSLQKVSDATGLKFDVVQSNVLARSLIKSQTRITSGYNHWTALQLANENKGMHCDHQLDTILII